MNGGGGERASGVDRLTLLVLALALCGSAVAFLPGQAAMGYDQFSLPKELVVAAGALVAGVLVALARRRASIDAASLCLLGFLGLGLVSLALARNGGLAWRSVGVLTGAAVLYWVAASLAAGGRRGAVWALVSLAGAVVAVTAIAEAHRIYSPVSMTGRVPGGLEGNRNFMAHGLVMALPAAMTLSLRPAASRWLRWFGLVATALMACAILLSRSRGAWLGAATMSAVMLALLLLPGSAARLGSRWRRLAPFAALALGVTLAVGVPNQLRWGSSSPYLDTLARLGESDAGTGRGRIIQYRATSRMIGAQPLLGVGPGNWSVVYPRHARLRDPSYMPMSIQPVNRLPNSDWLGLAAERGLPALACLLGFVALLGRATWRSRQEDDEAPLRAVGLFGVIAGLAVCGSFDAVLLRPTPAVLIGCSLGLFARTPAPIRLAGDWLGGRTLRAGACAAVALLAVVSVGRGLQAGRLAASGDRAALVRAASIYPHDYRVSARLALHAAQQGDCAEVRRWATAAVASYPHYPVARRLLAGCPRESVAARR